MEYFIELMKRIIVSGEMAGDSGEFLVNLDDIPDMEDSVITVLHEEDGQITLAVFSTAQWEIVEDLVSLTKQPQEDVVRSLAKDIPNVFTFNPSDYED
jgi:FPC/CPF motif-containing protein YcgG